MTRAPLRRRAARRPPRTRLPSRRRRDRPAPYDRADVLARWAGCCYCDGLAEELDHVIPLSRGGQDTASNLVAACRACNHAKSNRPLHQWAAEL